MRLGKTGGSVWREEEGYGHVGAEVQSAIRGLGQEGRAYFGRLGREEGGEDAVGEREDRRGGLRWPAGVLEIEVFPGANRAEFAEFRSRHDRHQVGEDEDSVVLAVEDDHETQVFAFDILAE